VRNRPGRVDQIIHLALPDKQARLELLRHFARNLTCENGELEKAAAGTDGATPATLKEVVKRAAVNALDRDGSGPVDAGIRITAQDLLLAYEQIQFMRPSKAPGAEIL
jgi:ATP-dependent 26S proteasome regulatory subunit